MKSIKLFSILVAAIVVSSCSSGGTGSQSGLNLTGNWTGTVSFTQTSTTPSGSGAFIQNSGVFSATMTVSQNQPIIPGTAQSEADVVIVIRSPDGCSLSLSALGEAIVNANANTLRAEADDAVFLGQIISNREIVGNFVDGTGDSPLICGKIVGPARFTR